jgi:pimeloyl-ACP methyl ester carboxylesterase
MMDERILEEFEGPVLLVAGDSDRFVDVEVLAAWAARYDGVSCEVLEGADHFLMMHLGDMRRVVDAWLAAT